MPPPRAVTKTLIHVTRTIGESDSPQLLRDLKSSDLVYLQIVKSAMEDDLRGSTFKLGMMVSWDSHNVRLSHTTWTREMETWDATHWAWFFALILTQASGFLPVFGGDNALLTIRVGVEKCVSARSSSCRHYFQG
jgi:hypothetical protein